MKSLFSLFKKKKVVELPLSNPYVFKIENLEDKEVAVDCFGFEDRDKPDFYEVVKELKTKTIDGEKIDYWDIIDKPFPNANVVLQNLMKYEKKDISSLSKSFAFSPCIISKFRFQSSNVKQLLSTIVFKASNANGTLITKPFNLAIYKDAYQQQTDQIDFTRTQVFDARKTMRFYMQPKATLIVSMFPTTIINHGLYSNKDRDIIRFKTPSLSGFDGSSVIVHSVFNWKDIKYRFKKLFSRKK